MENLTKIEEQVLNQFVQDLQKWTNPTKVTIIDRNAYVEIGRNFTKVKTGYIFDIDCGHVAEGTFTLDGTINSIKNSNAFNGSYKALMKMFKREERLEAKMAV